MRSLFTYLYIRVRLHELHLVHAVEDKIAYSIDTVCSVFLDTAGIDICEVCACSALLECYSYFYRCRLVVELDPKAFEELESSFIIKRAFPDILLIVRIQVLIEPSRAEQ